MLIMLPWRLYAAMHSRHVMCVLLSSALAVAFISSSELAAAQATDSPMLSVVTRPTRRLHYWLLLAAPLLSIHAPLLEQSDQNCHTSACLLHLFK